MNWLSMIRAKGIMLHISPFVGHAMPAAAGSAARSKEVCLICKKPIPLDKNTRIVILKGNVGLATEGKCYEKYWDIIHSETDSPSTDPDSAKISETVDLVVAKMPRIEPTLPNDPASKPVLLHWVRLIILIELRKLVKGTGLAQSLKTELDAYNKARNDWFRDIIRS